MTEFTVGKTVAQSEPQVTVDASSLSPGVHRFKLVVVDDSGHESEPTFLEIVVTDSGRPTAVLDVVNANGQRVEPKIAAGQPVILSGARSSDVAPGRVVEYRFTLVDRS
ncbi:hypothetical protein [Phenylobacterium sp.]|uniref:hypothetical protein n=1 Tax=Phenylobacterium sp. TaxID=1871053 RepID=UPI00301E3B21